MNILKRKGKKRKPTVDQEIRKIDLKTKKLAHKFLVEEAKVNPVVKLLLIEREFGIKIPELDPVKEVKERIHKVITDEAANKIESDPKLVKHFAEGLINSYAAELGIPTNDAPKTPFERDLLLIEQHRKIKEALGVKDANPVWDAIKSPQVVIGLIGLAGQLASMMRPDPKPSDPIYVVTGDGEDKEMTKDEYTAYKQTGALAKATSQNDPPTAGVLSETVQKATSGDDYQPGHGIRVLAYPILQKAA